ncbi:SMP-30/gluconolactonase/LRE family protein [Salinarimonas ramus]|uniref:Gluconolactonase n=1 Tax=Salinarimonas ramus TaxID=690164 RepID=A0A917V1C8_9HYPH|nr:SMP-30/gluconolactonase/LRE family protein [Salinarimonas ramus]GGK18383.1 gluconolactonase [Salinarimonas ramus]
MNAASHEVRLVLDCAAELGESPLWDAQEEALYFVDIKGRAIHRFHPASGAHAVAGVPEDIGCIGLTKGRALIAGMRSGVFLVGRDGEILRKLADNPEDQAWSRFNDGAVDPAGRFLVGTIDEERGGRAGLYRLDRSGLTRLLDGLMTSNGLAFSADGRSVFHADTPRFTVTRYAYDPATGTLGDGDVFCRLDADAVDRARPDGAALDVDGCYWTALYEGGRIQRWSPDGALLAEIAIHARCPTMVAFGGRELKTLYVTTARAGRPADELAREPHAGGLFALDVDVPGRLEPLFDPDV